MSTLRLDGGREYRRVRKLVQTRTMDPSFPDPWDVTPEQLAVLDKIAAESHEAALASLCPDPLRGRASLRSKLRQLRETKA